MVVYQVCLLMEFGIVPLGALPIGALAERFGAQVAGFVMGAFMLVLSIALIASRRLRKLKQTDGPLTIFPL